MRKDKMKKIYMIFIAIFMMIALVIPATADWPMFHHDLYLTGYSPDDAPNMNETLWTFQTSGPVYSSPAIVDGVVYVGSDDGNFYAINSTTGGEIWNFTAGAQIKSSPAVESGLVYFLVTDGMFYALYTENGTIKWSQSLNLGSWDWSSPAVHNGYVFIGSSRGYIYKLTAQDGYLGWSKHVGGAPNSHITVANEKVYSGFHNFDFTDPTLIALNETNGNLVWKYNYSVDFPGSVGMINHNGVTVADGDSNGYLNVYFGIYVWGDPGPQMICLNETNGILEWATNIGENSTSTPAYHNGNLFIGSDDDKVYSLDASDGSILWTFTTGGDVMSAPAVADDKVYFGSLDHIIYCVDEITGALIWEYNTSASHIYGSPAIDDGILYIGNENGKVYAFKDHYWRDETGWGDGIDFPGSDWSEYFLYEPSEELADEILLIVYNRSSDHFTHVEDALISVGYTPTALYNPSSGDIALLTLDDFDQIWLWDLQTSQYLTDSNDLNALVNWYSSHKGNIVLDGRSYGAVFGDDNDSLFIENIADAFSIRSGGLWIGYDDDDAWQYNANALLSALGYDLVSGKYNEDIDDGDTSCDLLNSPNVIPPINLIWNYSVTVPWSVGEAPTGLQVDGVTLLPLLWNDNDVNYTSYALGPITSGGIFKTDLIADGGSPATEIDVGDITVWNDSANLYVQYDLFDGWLLNKTHVHVSGPDGGDAYTVPDDFPITKINKNGKGGSPKVGKFDYYNNTHYLYPEAMRVTYLYTIPWAHLDDPTFIAAHASVSKWVPIP
jgi:outer membrane protein assembly factor BamB